MTVLNVPTGRPVDELSFILAHVAADARPEFLSGLSERITTMEADDTDEARAAVIGWVRQWFVSARLLADREWRAADDEASKLLDAGKVAPSTSRAGLRAALGR